MSRYTNLVVAHSLFQNFDYDIIVDWAIELLEEGNCSSEVQIVAGLGKPVNVFEARKYIEIILSDFSWGDYTKEENTRHYCSFFIQEIANDLDVRQNLKIVCKTCQFLDYEKDLYDFYLLYWAWDDLDYENYTPYWEEANRDNICNIVKEVANKWLNSYNKEKRNPTTAST